MFLHVLFLSDGNNSLFWTHQGQLFDWLEALLIRSTSTSRPSPFYPIFMLLSARRDMALFVRKTLIGHEAEFLAATTPPHTEEVEQGVTQQDGNSNIKR